MALADNLSVYYKLADTADSVGSNTLTNAGSSTFDSGKIGNAVTLNGSSQYLYAASNSAFDFTSTMSISCWIKCTGGAGTTRTIISKPIGSTWVPTYFRYIIRIENSNELYFYLSSSQVATTSTSGSFGADSTWKHVVCTYDGTTQKVYVDGTLSAQNTVTTAISTSSEPFVIGSRNASAAGEYFTGQIDELGLWSRAITSDEVTQLYNSGNGRTYPFGLVSGVGSFSLTGNDANLYKARIQSVDSGSFILTNYDVNFRLREGIKNLPKSSLSIWTNQSKS